MKKNDFIGYIFLISVFVNLFFLLVIFLKANDMNKLNAKQLSEKMMVAHQNPFGTEYDPRYLLKLGSEQIFKYDSSNKLAEDMRNAWENPFNKNYNHKDLLKAGAEEIINYEKENN